MSSPQLQLAHIDKTAQLMASKTPGKKEKGATPAKSTTGNQPCIKLCFQFVYRAAKGAAAAASDGNMPDGCGKEKHFLAEVGARETTTTPSDGDSNL